MPTAIVLIVVLANKLVLNTGCFVVGSLERTLLHDSRCPPSALCQTECLEHRSSKAQSFVREDGIYHMVEIHGPCQGFFSRG